jgi:hypothetical protein
MNLRCTLSASSAAKFAFKWRFLDLNGGFERWNKTLEVPRGQLLTMSGP